MPELKIVIIILWMWALICIYACLMGAGASLCKYMINADNDLQSASICHNAQ